MKLVLLTAVWFVLTNACFGADEIKPEPVSSQPFLAGVKRLLDGFDILGASAAKEIRDQLSDAISKSDIEAIQRTLDARTLCIVEINPEGKVKARRGLGSAVLHQAGFVPQLIKVINRSASTQALNITSPQAGPVYAGMTPLSAFRMQRQALRETSQKVADSTRFLSIEWFDSPPLARPLSGLEVEYSIALIYSRDPGQLEATLMFDIGNGSQDLGFRAEVPVLFRVQSAIPVKVRVRDQDGSPSTARFLFRDATGQVLPPQAKRLAPDFYFQRQVYRHDDEVVLLPTGLINYSVSRGPEYDVQTGQIHVIADQAGRSKNTIEVKLKRWIDPLRFGYFSGDHHIHGAGCAHYTSPTEGVEPSDMFRQIRGEGLNVGSVLTWGPCFDYQRRFFAPKEHAMSEGLTVMKYDLEISGFGSESFGHVCLLNLKDQEFPGSEGTKSKGWPKWTTPVMRWAKAQGAVTGYAHSASGLLIEPVAASKALLRDGDTDRDGRLSPNECLQLLLPQPFSSSDQDQDGFVIESELIKQHDQAADQLPNLAIPEMNGVGAMEIPVTVALGVCDFISAMDTARIPEWNMWYHILNCGFPLKVSGETDFPCMSGDRVGQGRVYVRLENTRRLDYGRWCDGLRLGRSYVSDGFAHALEFKVNDVAPGFGVVRLSAPETLKVRARVAFASKQPATLAHGAQPPVPARWIGDTVEMHGPPSDNLVEGGTRKIELIVNGRSVDSCEVTADGKIHDFEFEISITESSWVALRQFPQLHTNPVDVQVAGRPIRSSRNSALWLEKAIERLWSARGNQLPVTEQKEAREAFDQARTTYRKIADESRPGT